MTPTQGERTPEQWPQDRVEVDSEVSGHIGFGGALHIRIPWLKSSNLRHRKTQIELKPDERSSGTRCHRLGEYPRRAGGSKGNSRSIPLEHHLNILNRVELGGYLAHVLVASHRWKGLGVE